MGQCCCANTPSEPEEPGLHHLADFVKGFEVRPIKWSSKTPEEVLTEIFSYCDHLTDSDTALVCRCCVNLCEVPAVVALLSERTLALSRAFYAMAKRCKTSETVMWICIAVCQLHTILEFKSADLTDDAKFLHRSRPLAEAISQLSNRVSTTGAAKWLSSTLCKLVGMTKRKATLIDAASDLSFHVVTSEEAVASWAKLLLELTSKVGECDDAVAAALHERLICLLQDEGRHIKSPETVGLLAAVLSNVTRSEDLCGKYFASPAARDAITSAAVRATTCASMKFIASVVHNMLGSEPCCRLLCGFEGFRTSLVTMSTFALDEQSCIILCNIVTRVAATREGGLSLNHPTIREMLICFVSEVRSAAGIVAFMRSVGALAIKDALVSRSEEAASMESASPNRIRDTSPQRISDAVQIVSLRTNTDDAALACAKTAAVVVDLGSDFRLTPRIVGMMSKMVDASRQLATVETVARTALLYVQRGLRSAASDGTLVSPRAVTMTSRPSSRQTQTPQRPLVTPLDPSCQNLLAEVVVSLLRKPQQTDIIIGCVSEMVQLAKQQPGGLPGPLRTVAVRSAFAHAANHIVSSEAAELWAAAVLAIMESDPNGAKWFYTTEIRDAVLRLASEAYQHPSPPKKVKKSKSPRPASDTAAQNAIELLNLILRLTQDVQRGADLFLTKASMKSLTSLCMTAAHGNDAVVAAARLFNWLTARCDGTDAQFHCPTVANCISVLGLRCTSAVAALWISRCWINQLMMLDASRQRDGGRVATFVSGDSLPATESLEAWGTSTTNVLTCIGDSDGFASVCQTLALMIDLVGDKALVRRTLAASVKLMEFVIAGSFLYTTSADAVRWFCKLLSVMAPLWASATSLSTEQRAGCMSALARVLGKMETQHHSGSGARLTDLTLDALTEAKRVVHPLWSKYK